VDAPQQQAARSARPARQSRPLYRPHAVDDAPLLRNGAEECTLRPEAVTLVPDGQVPALEPDAAQLVAGLLGRDGDRVAAQERELEYRPRSPPET